MDILFRILVLVIISALGGLLYPVVVNILLMAGLVPTGTENSNFGYIMTERAVFVWMGAVVLGIVSLFIKAKWRYFLLICPLIAPSLFAFFYTLSSQ